jgi:hypothetical protein
MTDDFDPTDFFATGDRLSDISDLAFFAYREELRGDTGEARLLYGWTLELIDALDSALPEFVEVRRDVGDALQRLQEPCPCAKRMS